mgnify:CR=1 FL=1
MAMLREQRKGMMTLTTRSQLLAVCVCLLAVALVYAPGFGGFWIGDDLTNLHHFHRWAEDGRLWSDTLARFFQGISAQGSAYRPLSILSLSANYAIAGSHYPGWYAANFGVHLSNTLLIALIVLRIAAHRQFTGTQAAVLAALVFGLAPSLAEGVYWLSARADGWVTLLTLVTLYLWMGPPQSLRSRWWMPPLALALIALALGFKESAAVFPLQLALVALAWRGPLGLPRWCVVLGAFGMLAGFFALRAHLFGHAFWVYATPGADQAAVDWTTRLTLSLNSMGPWWHALTGGATVLSASYLIALAIAMLLLGSAAERRTGPLALALFAASGGMALATVLNLGAFLAHGEGGRLSYGPIAWLALALGVLLLGPATAVLARRRIAAVAALAVGALLGAALLLPQLARVRAAQDGLHALATRLPVYLETHPGYTLLLAPETDGQVVLLRNGQGALALPPLQATGLLDRVLPTLPGDLAERHPRIAGGMLTQFETRHFQHLEGDEVARLYDPAPPRWPDHYACWSQHERRIIELAAPDPADAASWTAALRADWERCAARQSG